MRQIVKGTLNNILNREQELFEERIEICYKCKLYLDDYIVGAICSPYLYLNPETNETTTKKKVGHYRGCGCLLGSKTRVKEAHCPAKKW